MEPEHYRKKIIGAITKVSKNRDNHSKVCLIPYCTNKAINSHSQQKGGPLASIAENGQVYATSRNTLKNLLRKNDRYNLQPIAKVTRFRGFCVEHDTSLFNEIENFPIDPHSRKHQFLLFLRSFCFEYATKRDSYELFKDFYVQAKPFLPTESKQSLEQILEGRRQFLDIDGPFYESKIFSSLATEDWECIETRNFSFPHNIGLSCAGTMALNEELVREHLIENPEKPFPFVAFTIFPNANGTDVFYSILSEFMSEASSFFLELAKCNISQRVNFDALARSEDTCMRPSLWEGIGKEAQSDVLRFMTADWSENTRGVLPQLIQMQDSTKN